MLPASLPQVPQHVTGNMYSSHFYDVNILPEPLPQPPGDQWSQVSIHFYFEDHSRPGRFITIADNKQCQTM